MRPVRKLNLERTASKNVHVEVSDSVHPMISSHHRTCQLMFTHFSRTEPRRLALWHSPHEVSGHSLAQSSNQSPDPALLPQLMKMAVTTSALLASTASKATDNFKAAGKHSFNVEDAFALAGRTYRHAIMQAWCWVEEDDDADEWYMLPLNGANITSDDGCSNAAPSDDSHASSTAANAILGMRMQMAAVLHLEDWTGAHKVFAEAAIAIALCLACSK